jgi:hypothetical protein
MIPAIMLTILTLVSFYIPFAQEMQLGISILLSYSVFIVRLSEDVPTQSDSIPLIMIYFLLCMAFSLKAMIWFSFKNVLNDTLYIPLWLKYLIINYISRLYFKHNLLNNLIKINNNNNNNNNVWLPLNTNINKRLNFNNNNILNKQNNKLIINNMIDLLNKFIFTLFILYAFLINTILLIIIPLFIKQDI